MRNTSISSMHVICVCDLSLYSVRNRSMLPRVLWEARFFRRCTTEWVCHPTSCWRETENTKIAAKVMQTKHTVKNSVEQAPWHSYRNGTCDVSIDSRAIGEIFNQLSGIVNLIGLNKFFLQTLISSEQLHNNFFDCATHERFCPCSICMRTYLNKKALWLFELGNAETQGSCQRAKAILKEYQNSHYFHCDECWKYNIICLTYSWESRNNSCAL